MTEDLKAKITELIKHPLKDEGCEIADLAVSKYKNKGLVRLFVYSEHGATIAECARLSRVIGDVIDGTDFFATGYTLEVSSPGLDRPLKSALDFRFRAGETVRIEFVDSTKKKLTAEIVGATDDEVEFKNDEAGQFKIGLAEIEQAKIIF